ncbi:MAG: tetratricopeptide repeat protein, partial [Pseudomonadota bacterium]
MTSPLIRGLALGAVLLLTACQTAEERAESYYQSGLQLLVEGDSARALVELRNVFEHDGFHKDARLLYATTLAETGEEAEAYSQYLRLIEQYPDTVDVRLTLAEIALKRGEWREVTRHADAAYEIERDGLRISAIRAAIAYRDALRDSDAQAEIAAVTQAKAVLEEAPKNIPALRIVIDAESRGATPEAALPLVDQALSIDPSSFEFHTAKLRLFTLMKDDPSAISQLEAMFARFPENPDVRTTLVNWHLAQKNFDAAESILRDLAGDPAEDAAGAMTVVQFLRQARGMDAALAELATLTSATEGAGPNALYRAMSAMILFEQDITGPGLGEMKLLVESLDGSDQSQRIRAMYARMLNAADDVDGSRALVEEILTADRTNIAALKLRAGWAIQSDAPDQAINDLRTALSQAPRDPEIMLLMATAHERAGFPELAGERLALAVEVSGAASEPALRYARYLIRDGRTQAAASVLKDARRAAPGDLELISVLADLYLADKDWPR